MNLNGFLQVQHSLDKTTLEYTGNIYDEVFDKYKVIKIETSLEDGPLAVQNTPIEKELER